MIPYWWFCAKPFLNLFLGDSLCSQDPGSLSFASKILLFLRVPTGVSLQPKRCIKDGVSSSAAQLCSFVRGLAWCWQVCTGPACWRLSRMNVPSTPFFAVLHSDPSWWDSKGHLVVLAWLVGFGFSCFIGGQWILAVPASSFHGSWLESDTFSPGGRWARVCTGLEGGWAADTAGVAPGGLVVAVTLGLAVGITGWRMPSAWRWRSPWRCEWMAAAGCGCWWSQSFGRAPGC